MTLSLNHMTHKQFPLCMSYTSDFTVDEKDSDDIILSPSDIQTYTKTDRQTGIHRDRQTDRQAYTGTDRQTYRQSYTETDRQTDRHTQRHTSSKLNNT